MKQYLVCSRCGKKHIVDKHTEDNIRSGLKYICACGGKLK